MTGGEARTRPVRLGAGRVRRALILAALMSIAVGSIASAASPMVLWRTIRVGMTEAEVLRQIPEAYPSDDLSPNKAGWVGRLRAHVREGARDEKVVFNFKDDRLIGVILMMGAPFGLQPIDGDAAKASFVAIRKAYGAPSRSFFTTDSFKSALWIKDGRSVGYLERPLPDIAVMVFINPEQPGDRDLFKDEKPAQIYPNDL
jgi:hypothetical protein